MPRGSATSAGSSCSTATTRWSRRLVEANRGRVVKTTGDGVLATFDGPARAIECARGATAAADPLGIELRAGLHAGECARRGADVGGMAVHIGARVAALARPGEVLVSGTLKDLVIGSGFEFDDRGAATLKGVPGEHRIYAVRVSARALGLRTGSPRPRARPRR